VRLLPVVIDQAFLPNAWAARLSLNPDQPAGATSVVLHQGVDPGLKTHKVRPELDPETRAFAERLDELIDVTASGRRWLGTGRSLAGI
jgi:hypothetical protein